MKNRFEKILSTNRFQFSVKLAICILLAFANLVIGEVLPVGDDDVIQKVNAHQLAGSFDAFCQVIIIFAGRKIA